MNIALFTDSYLPNTDGVVASILAYQKGLSALGHKFIIFAPDAKDAAPDPDVLRFSAVAFPPYPDYRAALPLSIPKKIAEERGITLVHSKGMMGMGIAAARFAKKCRLPSVASLETMIPEGMHYISRNKAVQDFGRNASWSYLRWLYGQFDIVTAPSAHTQVQLAENGVKSERLPSPIDTERFKPNSGGAGVKRELGLPGKKLILSVGRVAEEKNHAFLLRVAKKMKGGAKFVIVGKGPYLERLKQEAEREGVGGCFAFAGFVPDERIVDYYNAADAFVFPSKFETQGLTLLEALACGKPACVLRGTPMEEVVREGKNGFLFSLDEEECAEKLSCCLEKGKRMGLAARKTALDYSIPKCTERLLDIYKKAQEQGK